MPHTGDSHNSHKRGLLVRQPGPSPDNAPPTAYDDRGSPAEGSPQGGPSGFSAYSAVRASGSKPAARIVTSSIASTRSWTRNDVGRSFSAGACTMRPSRLGTGAIPASSLAASERQRRSSTSQSLDAS